LEPGVSFGKGATGKEGGPEGAVIWKGCAGCTGRGEMREDCSRLGRKDERVIHGCGPKKTDLEQLNLLVLAKDKFRGFAPMGCVLPTMLDEARRVAVDL
jgi:hypothetical protein